MFCLKAGTKWLHRCLMLAAFSGLLLNTARTESVEESAIAALQMQKDVTGVVLDEFGDPVIGASVSVAGTTNGTITDVDGRFTLQGVPDNATLNVSYLGYQTVTLRVDGRTNYTVTLKEDSQLIDEVIVIGYGTTTKKSVVGAVDQIGSKVIKDRPVGNVTQALQGASANLIIQQRSSDPTDNKLNINIRGISTMNDNSPLIVIDGMTSDSGSLNRLNPNDIETVTVLKDAGSSAIYGSRAANGVILVTTKKGRVDMKPVVSFNASVGSQNPNILLKPLPAYQNALLRNDSKVNAGLAAEFTPEQIREFANTPDAEWGLKTISRNALQQNYNVSVQGGSKSTTYMISFGYYDQESNWVGQDFGTERYNFRSNLITDIGRLKLTTIMAYNRVNSTTTPFFHIADAMRTATYPEYNLYPDEDGKYYNNTTHAEGNLLATLTHGGNTKNDNDHFQGIVNGEFDIWNGLKAKALFGYELRQEHRLIRNRYYPVYSFTNPDQIVNAGSSNGFHVEDYNGKITTLNTQFLLDYNRTFNGIHTVSAMAGYTQEMIREGRNEIKRKYVGSELYEDTDDTDYDTGSYNSPDHTTERAIYSWLGRIHYSYMDKYYAEVSARYDGSSKFASENRWGFFPSLSLGWRISEEDFMVNYKEKFGDIKIRGSYGVLGNQNVDDYQYFTTYETYSNGYAFNDNAVTTAGYTFGNRSLKWETTTTFDIGVDMAFLNNSLQVSADYFNKYTKDILLTPQTPSTLGGAVPKANMGEMRNQGWEVTINYNLRHGDFEHSFGFNIGDSFNKVVKFGDESIQDVGDEIKRIIREGLPFNSYYGYKTDGFYQNWDEIQQAPITGIDLQPGDVRYVDRNGDGIINEADRFVLGNAFPRYTFGFNYMFNWKGIDFNMLWQGVGKRTMGLRGEMIEPFHGSYYVVMFEHQLDYWTPDNPNARYPRLINSQSPSYSYNYGKGSDLNMQNAAYLRLKNLQIGYTIPKNISRKVGSNKIRVYATGQDLWTISKLKFMDVEHNEFGGNMNVDGYGNSGRNYPTTRYYGGGIEIEF